MPSTLPDGEPAPPTGELPDAARSTIADTPLSFYLHVPFCTTRCGYCDFNTYTAAELGDAPGASRRGYADAAIAEVDLARRVLGDAAPPVSTVFVGGGTPTLLPPDDLGRMLAAIRDRFGLTADAEITTESNPESIDADGMRRLADHGFTRISFGMQSVRPHVLAVLDRVHTPGRPEQAVAEAKQAGIAQTSLDLIYGTPGETLADWQASLAAAIAAGPDHVSAYSLIVEPGTRLATRIRRGELPMTDDDDLADKYELAEQMLSGAGYHNYEISNWATNPATKCRHNLAYWYGHNWWGIGPGAHSHVGGVRWWNVKHPAAYAARIDQGVSPAHAREVLDVEARRTERVLLELRLDTGLDAAVLTDRERARVPELVHRGLVTTDDDQLLLTPAGRLLADGIVRDLLD
ncbi:radical SAM family heme chaperone HemW [Microlunatus soli]|uniref:Heme chaperone HemW n=1 Tax=Microlunatus soli TaxID=630515 RepID=A0A1H1YQW2_9ACTN|nr:radical SAM family heme chaperone HemW [Microlunatus soli]SDT23885.1 oxygen-independent coproporphyrinogen-3 oxidase [Microlunatus soli]